MNASLVIREDSALGLSTSPLWADIKDEALATASLVPEKIVSEIQHLSAVDAQKCLKEARDILEASRKDAKQPALDRCREIDALAKAEDAPLETAWRRVSRAEGDFQQAEIARTKAAEALRNEELNRIEREREEAKAQAKTIDEQQRINEEASIKMASVPVPLAPARVEGQTVRPDFEYEIENPHLVYASDPTLMKLVPKDREIKEKLRSGLTIRGIRSWPVVKTGVRTTAPKTIEIAA